MFQPAKAVPTLNAIGGWGFGFPLSTQKPSAQYVAAAVTAAANQSNKGIYPYTDAEMWTAYRFPKEMEQITGDKITLQNYKYYATAEIGRLSDLGFAQVHEPKITQAIGKNYFAWANSGAGYPAEHSYWHYVGNNFQDLMHDTTDVIQKTGTTLSNITSPIGLSSLAVLAVVGAAFYFSR